MKIKDLLVTETIIEIDGKFRLVSKKGKNLGDFDTKEEAIEHEKEVQYFKHKDK